MMSGFPGRIFDGEGNPLDGRASALTQDQLDACEHRSMVVRGGVAPVVRVWLLADDATFAAIPQVLLDQAVALLLAGNGIVIMSQRPEPGAEIRGGLIQTLDLYDAPDDAAGHA
jgi:hypothetical protein